jgi:uncharacterized protein with ParB-like and HNH nuclease domain
MEQLEIKAIKELLAMKFFIPSYQRGYRWTEQQVRDLLDDISDFDPSNSQWYCLQPLVVRKKDDEWEVIDGQQRLTTIFLIIHYMNEMWVGKQKIQEPSIRYETREESYDFLNKIEIVDNSITIDDSNIDFYYISKAYQAIHEWVEEKIKEDFDNNDFQSKFKEKTKVIWYECDEYPIRVFTRLNIGKIPLTNSELIKALFLNSSNFGEEKESRIKLRQQEIAGEWDGIEYTLQKDEFWLFLNKDITDKRSTRIDFIFDIICEKNRLNLPLEAINTLGNDKYRTFRYFYAWFKSHKKYLKSMGKKFDEDELKGCWAEVKLLFQTFQEWYNDLRLYHYIGFLIENGSALSDILDKWYKAPTRDEFVDTYLVTEIRQKIASCCDLNKQYEVSGAPKTQCRPILLLHNIQTIVDQNKDIVKNEKYKLPVFYKFPFHLYKREHWNVEHIDSNTENGLEEVKTQKEWLKCSSLGIEDSSLKEEIRKFLKEDEPANFEDLKTKIDELTGDRNKLHENNEKNDNEKNKLWNFALLDESTNKSYGNSIFPAKRRVIIGKDQGKKFSIDDDIVVSISDADSAFVPPCTKNLFLKYYNTAPNNMRDWSREDAEAYLNSIKTTLSTFLKQS